VLPHMHRKLRRVCKFLTANFAGEFFSCMFFHVDRQMRRLSECLRANATLPRSVSCVRFQMRIEDVSRRKFFFAVTARKRFLPSVRSHVNLEITCFNVSFFATIACIRFFPSVDSHVNCQLGGYGKALEADVTLKRLLPCMSSDVLSQM
jgi:hypothetical protein